MKILLSIIAIIFLMIATLLFGLYHQFGSINNIPNFETIIYLLKSQHPKYPDSIMILTVYIIATIFLPILFIVSLFKYKHNNEYGYARYATFDDIKKFKLNSKSGIILGQRGTRLLRSQEPLSTLCVAPPGTGKSAGFTIPNALAYEQSLFVLDIKGEISEKTAAYRSNFSKIIIFDPANKENKTGFNPFDKSIIKNFDQNEINQHVLQIAELIFQNSKVSNSDMSHWYLESKNLFVFIAIYLIFISQKSNTVISIPGIRSFALSSQNLKEHIFEILEENQDLPQLARELGNALIQKAEKEFSGLFSTFQTKLLVFQDDYVAKSFSFNSFTPEQFREENISFYFKIKEIDAERLAPLVRLTLDFFVKTLLKKEKKKDDLNILFLLDEFPRFGSIPILLKLPAIGRSYGLLAMFFFQSNGQIAEIYQRHGMEELDATTAYKIILTQNEAQTAKSFSDSIGNTTRLIKKGTSKSKNNDFFSSNSGSSSSNENLEGVPLIRTDELLSLPFGEIIVLVQGFRNIPIKAKTPFWFKNPQMLEAVEKI